MEWWPVRAEGTSFDYLIGEKTPCLSIQCANVDALGDGDTAVSVLRTERARIVRFPNMLDATSMIAYYLYWLEKSDLNRLDRKVKGNRYGEGDFSSSIKCVFNHTFCNTCSWRGKTLVVPPGDPYPEAPGLMDHKINRATFCRCPKCGSYFRQMVLIILSDESRSRCSM